MEETFVMPLWVSKCPGGSKCQRHTRRLRLGRKPNSVPCAMLKSMGYEMCQGSYMQLRWTLRIYPGMYPHLSSIDVRWWDSMILQPKMEIIKACTGSRLFERFLFGAILGGVFRIKSPKVCLSDMFFIVFPFFPVISCTWLGVYNQLIHCSGSAELRTCNVNMKKKATSNLCFLTYLKAHQAELPTKQHETNFLLKENMGLTAWKQIKAE